MRKISELATELGVSQNTILRLCKDGRIKAVRVGRVWRIPDQEFRRVIEEGTREQG